MVGVVEEVRGEVQMAKEDNQRLLALNTTLQVSLSPFTSVYIHVHAWIQEYTCMVSVQPCHRLRALKYRML